MERISHEIADCVGPRSEIVEYGSGSGRKTAVLLRDVTPAAYVAIDISDRQLRSAVAQLAAAHPRVKMAAVCADYSKPLEVPRLVDSAAGRRVIFFPGSTIGN